MAKRQEYLLSLGSNMRHPRHGAPDQVLRAALACLEAKGARIEAASPVMRTDPVGPSRRRFANCSAVVSAKCKAKKMLRLCREIEAEFGRRRSGQRWRARVLDIDIVLWSGGARATDTLVIPHPLFRARDFVLRPSAAIAGGWRDPLTGLTVRHLFARLTKPRPIPR